MDLKEYMNTVEALEPKVERLKALYQQYFMGIEKIPPHVLKKDVDRTIWRLRRIRLQNTQARFKFQQIIQRYNTYNQYWQRILREIEKGTYRRDVVKAAKRFGKENTRTASGRLADAALRDVEEEEAPQEQVWDLSAGIDSYADDAPTPAPAQPATFSEPAIDSGGYYDPRDWAPHSEPQPTQQGHYAQQQGHYAQQHQGGYAQQQGHYAQQQGHYAQQQGHYAQQHQGGYAQQQGHYAQQQGHYAQQHQGGYAPPPPPTRQGHQAPPPSHPGHQYPQGYPQAPAQGYAAQGHHAPQGYPAPPRPPAPPPRQSHPGGAPSSQRAPAPPPPRRSQPHAGVAPPPEPTARGHRAPPPPPARPAPPHGNQGPPPAAQTSASKAAQPKPSTPGGALFGGRKRGKTVPKKAGDGQRAVFDKYVQAKQRAGEDVSKLSYDKVRRSLDKQAEKLRKQHGKNRKVEFEVVEKDGKALIRPVVK
jgi:hypothetical protein